MYHWYTHTYTHIHTHAYTHIHIPSVILSFCHSAIPYLEGDALQGDCEPVGLGVGGDRRVVYLVLGVDLYVYVYVYVLCVYVCVCMCYVC
jgi:hypothetical protein